MSEAVSAPQTDITVAQAVQVSEEVNASRRAEVAARVTERLTESLTPFVTVRGSPGAPTYSKLCDLKASANELKDSLDAMNTLLGHLYPARGDDVFAVLLGVRDGLWEAQDAFTRYIRSAAEVVLRERAVTEFIDQL